MKCFAWRRLRLTALPHQTSANGPNWIQALRTTYSVNPELKGYNLAYGGATVDAKFVTPYLPTVLSLKGKSSVCYPPRMSR